MRLFLHEAAGDHLTQAPEYGFPSVEEDDASRGAGGGRLGLEQPHGCGSKTQVGYHKPRVLLDSHAVVQKLNKSGHGANPQFLKYIPLLEVRERAGDIRRG